MVQTSAMLTYIKNSRISCIYVLEQCINAAIKRPPGTLQHVSTQQEYGLKLDSSSLISIPEDISWTKLDHPKIEQEKVTCWKTYRVRLTKTLTRT